MTILVTALAGTYIMPLICLMGLISFLTYTSCVFMYKLKLTDQAICHISVTEYCLEAIYIF